MCAEDEEPLAETVELELVGFGGSSPHRLGVSIADATATERDGRIEFEVTLTRESERYVEVYFETTTDGTATEEEDFVATAEERLIAERALMLRGSMRW